MWRHFWSTPIVKFTSCGQYLIWMLRQFRTNPSVKDVTLMSNYRWVQPSILFWKDIRTALEPKEVLLGWDSRDLHFRFSDILTELPLSEPQVWRSSYWYISMDLLLSCKENKRLKRSSFIVYALLYVYEIVHKWRHWRQRGQILWQLLQKLVTYPISKGTFYLIVYSNNNNTENKQKLFKKTGGFFCFIR